MKAAFLTVLAVVAAVAVAQDFELKITKATKQPFALSSAKTLNLFEVNDVCPDDYKNRFSVQCIPRVPVDYVKFFSNARGMKRERAAPYFVKGNTRDGRVLPIFFGQQTTLNITCKGVPTDLATVGRLTPVYVILRKSC